jgi:hypothetical protein
MICSGSGLLEVGAEREWVGFSSTEIPGSGQHVYEEVDKEVD